MIETRTRVIDKAIKKIFKSSRWVSDKNSFDVVFIGHGGQDSGLKEDLPMNLSCPDIFVREELC